MNSFSQLNDNKEDIKLDPNTDRCFGDNLVFRIDYENNYWTLKVFNESTGEVKHEDRAEDARELNCKVSSVLLMCESKGESVREDILEVAKLIREYRTTTKEDIINYLRRTDLPKLWRINRQGSNWEQLKSEFKDLPVCDYVVLSAIITGSVNHLIRTGFGSINYDEEILIPEDRWKYCINLLTWFNLSNDEEWQDLYADLQDKETRFNNRKELRERVFKLYNI